MDLAQRRQQLRLKQVDAVKKFRQSNTFHNKRERDQMKKKSEKKLKAKLNLNQLILRTLMEL